MLTCGLLTFDNMREFTHELLVTVVQDHRKRTKFVRMRLRQSFVRSRHSAI